MSDRYFAFEMFTIYHNPSDYPGQYVVRRWTVHKGSVIADANPVFVGTQLEAAREPLRNRGLLRVERAEADDPAIVEVWM